MLDQNAKLRHPHISTFFEKIPKASIVNNQTSRIVGHNKYLVGHYNFSDLFSHMFANAADLAFLGVAVAFFADVASFVDHVFSVVHVFVGAFFLLIGYSQF